MRPSSDAASLSSTNGPPVDRVHPERSVLPSRTALEVAGRDLDLDAGRAQPREALPADLRRGSPAAQTTRAMPASISASAHGGWRPWCEQGSSDTYAVAPCAPCGTGEQRVRLGMALARPHVPALAEHLAVAHDHAADDRVRARRAAAPLGELERPLEQPRVVAGHAKPAAATIAR